MARKVEAHQVPSIKCPKENCTGDIRWGIFYSKGFENDKIQIGNVCSNKLCKKKEQYDPRKTEQENEEALTHRWVKFTDHGLWINSENWEQLKLASKDLAERKIMKIEKKSGRCGFKGCKDTDVEKHHIMPKGYCVVDPKDPDVMNADDWPVVLLCSYHHMRWHATLTAGLTQRADSYNWANLPKFYKMLNEAGIDAYEDVNYWNRLTAYRDLREALHAEAKAKQAHDAAMKRVENAKFTLETYLLMDEENAEYET